MKFLNLLFITGLCMTLSMGASKPAYGQMPLKFRHISYKEGLAQSPIAAIWQDEKGLIWIGSLKGLTRFDGYDFFNYKHKDGDKTTLSNNHINVICQDNSHDFWIGTSNGLNRFDRRTGHFTSIDIRRDVKGGRNYISSIINDSRNQLWAATFGGVKRLNPQTRKLEDLGAIAPDLNTITFTLFEAADHTIWVGTKNGVLHFDPQKKILLPLASAINGCAPLNAAKVVVIKQDRQRHIWFGTEASGVFEYDEQANTMRTYQRMIDKNSLLSNYVKDIYVPNSDEVWFATRGGLSIYHRSTQKFTAVVHDPLNNTSLDDNSIWAIAADRSGDIWLGTFSGGLNISNPSFANFNNITEKAGQSVGLSHPVANAVIQDKGALWVGTFSGGINYIDRGPAFSTSYSVEDKQQPQPVNGVKSLAQDKSGNLWIGSFAGLCRFNKTSHQITYFRLPAQDGKLSATLINAVLTDDDGVWAGTNGGGLQFISYKGSVKPYVHSKKDPRSISDNFVTALLKDNRGNIWVGTQNGLNYYDKATGNFTVCYKKGGREGLNTGTITSLLLDKQQNLWVGTDGGGLSHLAKDGNHFDHVSSKTVQLDDVIRALVQDQRDNIWASTDNGIYQIIFSGKDTAKSLYNCDITRYAANDGLASNQFLNNAALVMPDGELVFGGINGLSTFYPNRLIHNPTPPGVVLTDLMIRNKSVKPGEAGSPLKQEITDTHHIYLTYDQGFISIQYAALNFVSKNNQYAYRLEGLENDSDWHFAGNQRIASYTNLAAGNYLFKVKAANNNGVWNQVPVELAITVLPPWWKTWWAYLFYTTAATAVAWLIIRFFRARAKLKQDLFLEHRDNERNQELYKMKLDFFTNISHELRTPLTLIAGPVEELIATNADSVTVGQRLTEVKKNTDRLVRLVGELMDFRKAESGNLNIYVLPENLVVFCREMFLAFESLARRKNISYRFICTEQELTLHFDKDQLEKVLFNLLSNAFKFTPDNGAITLEIKAEDGLAHIKVSDNGKGIAPENLDKVFNNFFQGNNPEFNAAGTGVGLALSKSIVELHHGSISVTSTPATTCFMVSLKMGIAHFTPGQLSHEIAGNDNTAAYYLQNELSAIIDFTPKTGAKAQTLLLVEDNPEIMGFLQQSLSHQYHVITAQNGKAALAVVFETIPDLIVSDVMMPEMDGLEFCRLVKTDERTSHIPVILLTARAAYIHQLNGLETGAEAYIVKPFSTRLLNLTIRNLLTTREAIRQKFSRQVTLQVHDLDIVTPDDRFLHKLMDIVEKNISDPDFDVTGLSNHIGMSKTVLYKKVNSLTGMAVADFIKSVRLKRAAMLLLKQQLSVADVAFAVGFNDRKYFSKEFRKQFNCAPSAYTDEAGLLAKTDLPQSK